MRRSEEERCDAFRAAVESVLSSGAGYLILQGQFLSRNELIAAFVEEADCLAALVKRVSSERARIYTDRYPQVFAP